VIAMSRLVQRALWLAAVLSTAVPAGQPLAQGGGCAERLPADRTSMELRGADIPTTLRLLAQRYRLNMLITEDVAGTVTLSFFDVPVREVFRTIITSANLVCLERDGVVQVSTAARMAKLEEDRLRSEQARARDDLETRKRQAEIDESVRRRRLEEDEALSRGPLREETIKLLYADALDVAETLQGVLGIPATGGPALPQPGIYQPLPPTQIPDPSRLIDPSRLPEGTRLPFGPPPAGGPPAGGVVADVLGRGLTIRAHRPTNTIFIRYYANDLDRIRRLVKENLDVPLPQVQIAAQVVSTARNALEQLGIQWGGSAFIADKNSATLVGTGFAQRLDPVTGLPTQPATSTPASPGQGISSGFTPAMPINPTSGLPTGGNLVNLPISFLPTLANPAFGAFFGLVSKNFNINLAIQALEVQGRARSLSEPKIVTVQNAKAVMSRGFEVPYVSQTGFGGTQVQFKDALLKLEVTPSVIYETSGTRIKMKVLVENNEPDFTRQVLGNPPIFKRRAEAEVVMREGERLVIGGVLIENETSTVRQVPGLGRIPVLGWLFKSREISTDSGELLVIIAPTVIPATTAAR
jgi:type IV pilus assembly protein PilQ